MELHSRSLSPMVYMEDRNQDIVSTMRHEGLGLALIICQVIATKDVSSSPFR